MANSGTSNGLAFHRIKKIWTEEQDVRPTNQPTTGVIVTAA
jgi:hypothetical protein